MHPGSGSPRKNWEGMDDVARDWQRARPTASSRCWVPPSVERGTRVPADVVVAGEPLERVAAMLRRAHRYLGNDSGISHLAGLLGARGVVLFGTPTPRVGPRSASACTSCRRRAGVRAVRPRPVLRSPPPRSRVLAALL